MSEAYHLCDTLGSKYIKLCIILYFYITALNDGILRHNKIITHVFYAR